MQTLSQYSFQRVLVNSDDQGGEKTHYNFSVRFTNPLQGRYKIHYITIPNTLDTIVLDINNELSVSDGGPFQTITIPEGYYTLTEAATALKIELDAALTGPFTVVVGAGNKLQISRSAAGIISFEDTGTANRTFGLYETKVTSLSMVAPGASFPNPVFLGDPLSIGIEIQEASDAGYVTAGGEYKSETVTGQPTKMTDRRISSKQQATLIVPLIAGANTFNYTTHDDFKQFIKLEKGTKTLTIRTVYPVTGATAQLRGPWEFFIERIEDDLSKPKLKRHKRTFL